MNPDSKTLVFTHEFRTAIISARDANLFSSNDIFAHFPCRCCGDSCYLLAEYLRRKGLRTIYVCGDFDGQTHAWLVLDDERVTQPQPRFYEMPETIKPIFSQYGNEITDPICVTRYEEKDVENGLIIDITADQFGGSPVYVGSMNAFYSNFQFRNASLCSKLPNPRLVALYDMIATFLPQKRS